MTGPGPGRSVEGRLARLHLRGGLIALARAELETMAGLGTLDGEALADLAEVRWRSGDLLGGGEAASAHMDAGGEEPLAMIVAAEALAAEGRLVEARQLAQRVTECAPGLVERLFAGEAQSRPWASLDAPHDGDPEGPAAWGSLAGGREVIAPDRPARSGVRDRCHAGRPADSASAVPATSETGGGADHELAAVEDAIDRRAVGSVAARLALLLRLERSLAPAVLSLADRAMALVDRNDGEAAALDVVRGDAYRILGREADATAAFERARVALEARSDDHEEAR